MGPLSADTIEIGFLEGGKVGKLLVYAPLGSKCLRP